MEGILSEIGGEIGGGFAAVPLWASGLRLGAALLLGGAVGLEREARGKPAGLRTHMLVAMAACLFILVSQELGEMQFGDHGEMQIDPLRLVEAVTAGVAFLAAGIIFTSGGRVRYVTTGASLWLAGAIGLACGSGQIGLALLATVIVVIVLGVVGFGERRLTGSDAEGEDPPED
ncbi:MgtC/SapB family protein [Rhodobacterales bacterium HKCCE2091]|nr:MgtC/SapB family protein [Rhodobacterales bacterium HKCCE2091]